MVQVLQARVAELESQVARDSAVFARTSAEHEKLLTQLLTARSNNDILAGNIEALKGLATQLATKLEEANLQLATMRDSAAVSDMKLRRDTALEIVNIQKDAESRLEAMRKELQQAQEDMKAMRDEALDADLKAEIAAAKVAAGKDHIIADLRREAEVLRAQLEYVSASKSASKPARTRSRTRIEDRSGSTVGISPIPQDRGSSSSDVDVATAALRRGMVAPTRAKATLSRTAWDSASESEVSAANRSVLDVKVCVNKTDFNTARFRGGPQRSSGIGTRYHVDVLADGTFLDEIPFRTAQKTQLSSPSSTRFAPADMSVMEGAVTERCAFLAATGEEIRVVVEVVPLASN